jgi:hypothetical protein
MVFDPSAAVKPDVQVVPLSTLYCTVAPVSRPVTLSVPTLLMPSPATPESVVKANQGAATVLSSVKLRLADGDWLPAISVCRTRTAFAPSIAVKLDVQFAPLSVLY